MGAAPRTEGARVTIRQAATRAVASGREGAGRILARSIGRTDAERLLNLRDRAIAGAREQVRGKVSRFREQWQTFREHPLTFWRFRHITTQVQAGTKPVETALREVAQPSASSAAQTTETPASPASAASETPAGPAPAETHADQQSTPTESAGSSTPARAETTPAGRAGETAKAGTESSPAAVATTPPAETRPPTPAAEAAPAAAPKNVGEAQRLLTDITEGTKEGAQTSLTAEQVQQKEKAFIEAFNTAVQSGEKIPQPLIAQAIARFGPRFLTARFGQDIPSEAAALLQAASPEQAAQMLRMCQQPESVTTNKRDKARLLTLVRRIPSRAKKIYAGAAEAAISQQAQHDQIEALLATSKGRISEIRDTYYKGSRKWIFEVLAILVLAGFVQLKQAMPPQQGFS